MWIGIIVAAVLASMPIIEFRSWRNAAREPSLTLLFLVLVGSAVAAIIEHFVMKPSPSAVAYAGFAAMALGYVVRFIAVRTLGRYFTYDVKIQKKHELLQSGIYSSLRHPGYTGIILLWLGAGIALQSITGVALTLIAVIPALLYRIRIEEAALRKAFGTKYVAYAAQTKRLVPGIY
ncbi:isoprenylcysteine carboxylmethyltransferase family protein [Candidatus Woesearchaeota archaeon]|nr:isoprenylcysteine carboxylmethyltransferase family protein [Candidatus Woesearchaeota archaeon]